ncbi:hypothetical protein JEZ13_08745 [bacterium]|nr:hypothetical protein [bacterium]
MKYFLIIISVLLLLSCDSSTSPSDESFTLSGKVSLMDTEGNPVTSGLEDIIVMIYNTVDIDPDLLQVKADYPHIGAEINQEVFFDIRDAEPIKTVNCNSAGEYSFSIAKGDYNLCYYKEDYGYKLIHELEVSSDQSLAEAVLNEVISLAGSISNFTFESGKVYHITDDLVVPANSNISFETGAYVDVANNKKIFMMDSFNITEIGTDNYVKINSIYNIAGEKYIFRGIECVNINSLNISNVSVKNSSSAILLQSSVIDVTINNCVLSNNSNSISSNSNSTFVVTNCLIVNNSGIGITSNSNSEIKNSIFFSNDIGFKISMNATEIYNCYLLNNYMGIRTVGYQEQIIRNNDFDKNDYGITASGSSPNIEYNSFRNDSTDIEVNRMFISTGIYNFSNPIITNNNFFKEDRTIIDLIGKHVEGLPGDEFHGNGVSSNINATNNYWKSTVYTELCEYNTNTEANQGIIFLPKRNNELSNAGIVIGE